MFTGIIQDIGEIAAIDKKGDWTLTIRTQKLPLEQMALGASVACAGICLTVIEKNTPLLSREGADDAPHSAALPSPYFKVQISMETLSKTTAIHWRVGQRINLEPALRMGDELGGHLLSGHVDGIARVIERTPDGDSLRYTFEAPESFARFLASKGSAAIDGVSLTVNEVAGPRFGVNIIPHTRQMTTFSALNVGDEVNFEVDMIARYVERMMNDREKQIANDGRKRVANDRREK